MLAPPSVSKVTSAAIGAAQLVGTNRLAVVANRGCGTILVRIEMALIPGSNTPKPPACQIQV